MTYALFLGFMQVFVDHPSYHRPGNPYGDANGAFSDNQVLLSSLSLQIFQLFDLVLTLS